MSTQTGLFVKNNVNHNQKIFKRILTVSVGISAMRSYNYYLRYLQYCNTNDKGENNSPLVNNKRLIYSTRRLHKGFCSIFLQG